MQVIVAIIKFFVDEIFSKPYYLVGLMTAVGLIALRRPWSQVIGGTVKATMGFLILVVGAVTVINALDPLGKLILGATGARGVVPTNEAIVALAQREYGALTAWLMFVGFFASLLIARLTNLRYVFLTGHHIFYMATMLAVILVTVGIGGTVAVIVGAFLLGTIMVIMPAFAHPWMRAVTGGEKIAMGHFGSLGYIAGGLMGQLVTRVTGRKGRSTEEIEFPASLRFLREPMVGTAVAMFIIYLVFALWYLARVGAAMAIKGVGLAEGTTVAAYLMAQVLNALNFGVGVAVILLGVRTIIGEIVPAFAGIAERVVPGALPALDCPVAFPYAPNAVLIGFLTSVLGGLVSLGLIAVWLGSAWALALILPGMVPHFFTGGTAGVFGNATGGRWGAAWGGFANGVLITFLPAFLLKVLGALGFANTTFGDTDFAWYGIVVGNLARSIGIIGVVVAALVLIALASWFQRAYVERGWSPVKASAGGRSK
ncbi:MAG: PTS ascorbate transporter subunit IIC [Armatimonadota bacterium]|nr:PTS ascorbate transporter subunit IIC [Armatimonadota bacterium]MDR7437750.1 PTS ascorbate transporter subunit IIC [Armatimonadota bacterium]MDR7473287.1 PTS ascorbate transporter subunit IIC [Armatimonadota bacterium]MDR7506504.1 PTS ascorbate transporter subunit IIC [Armatimonadota bacterium]MDR7510352.1 PTS ascorbate transporter subunit IIC [Armatimonadota bacterium]